MPKILQLPEELYETIEREARRRRIDPVEFVTQAVELKRELTTLELLRQTGQTKSRPRPGPCMKERPPLLKTKDGSLVSDLVIEERR